MQAFCHAPEQCHKITVELRPDEDEDLVTDCPTGKGEAAQDAENVEAAAAMAGAKTEPTSPVVRAGEEEEEEVSSKCTLPHLKYDQVNFGLPCDAYGDILRDYLW